MILFTTHTILPAGSALAASRENCSCLQGPARLSLISYEIVSEKKILRKPSCYQNFPNKRGHKFVITLHFVEFSFTGKLIYKDTLHSFYILSSAFKTWYAAVYSTSRTLRSSSPVNFNLKSYGYRAFTVSAPDLWNKLPDDIRSCDNLNLFKRKLKTHLFKNYFNAWSLFLFMSSAYILDIRFMNIYILLMLT